MLTKMQKDFLNVRKTKMNLLSRIDTLQSKMTFFLDTENEEEYDKISDVIDSIFEKMFKCIDMFEQCYKTSYDNMETDWLINDKKF